MGHWLLLVARADSRVLRMCPLWSLSVEDLLQWRRLYSATSAVPIPAWFPRCAASSSEYATWKPSLCGFRKRTNRSWLRLATRTCWCRIASPRTSDERWRDAAERQRSKKPRLDKQERIRGAFWGGAPLRCARARYLSLVTRASPLRPHVRPRCRGPPASSACPRLPPVPASPRLHVGTRADLQ